MGHPLRFVQTGGKKYCTLLPWFDVVDDLNLISVLEGGAMPETDRT